MERDTEKYIELLDKKGKEDIDGMLNKKDTIFVALHNPGSRIEADKPVKHVFESGKIETLPSGAQYRVDENGCWHKID